MAGPSWLAAVLAAVAIAVSCYCAYRLATASGLARSLRPATVFRPVTAFRSPLARRRWRVTEVDGDAVHVVMGVAMAGMLVPRLGLLPGSAWTAVFAVAGAWFAGNAIRGLRASGGVRRNPQPAWRSAHPMPHLVECLAMIYMLVAVPRPMAGDGAAMPGMATRATPGGSLVALAVLLAIFMVGYVLWTADQLTSLARAASTAARAASAGRAARPAVVPVLAACSRIAMGLTMGYMLLAML